MRILFPRPLFIILVAVFFLHGASSAQDMLDVARTQMAAGLTADARLLVEGRIAAGGAGRDRALYYRALLTARSDSALGRLLELAGQGGRSPETLAALERLGDLAYARGQYSEAISRFQTAADRAADPATSRRAMVKRARAELRLGRAGDATRTLRQAAALGEEETHRGMLRYHLALAKEQDGDTNGAAEDFLAVYLNAQSPYQLAALSRLTRIYGRGSSERAEQWRVRLAESSGATVFDPAWVRPEGGGQLSATGKAPAESRTAPAAGGAGWAIQLGAFSSAARAGSLAEEIRQRTGLKPMVIPSADGKLQRVRLTGLATKDELKRIEAVLKKQRIKYHVIEPGG